MLRSAITEEFYDSIFDINVKGLLSTVQKALPLLVSDGASIILTASVVSQQRVGDERF
jgi:NAD(P)-dependent dehydrogenase (short-subunit alcohol dehydrogenase family)